MRPPVRVLHVCGRMKPGGITRFVEAIAGLNADSDTRHDILLTFADGPSPRAGASIVHRLDFGRRGALAAMSLARRIYREYDAVMIHGPHPVAVLPLAGLKVRRFLFQHGLAISTRRRGLASLKRQWYSVMQSLADMDVICSTEFARAKSETLGVRFRRGRVHIVPFGTGIPRRLEPRTAPGSAVRVGVIGRLEKQKRQHLVLESLAGYRGARRFEIVIAGDGPERPVLEALAKTVSTDAVRVTFAGNVDDMVRLYDTLDLVAFPSAGESFGLVAVEAMMRGVPVAVFPDVGGCLPLVRPGETGFIVEDQAAGLRALWERIDRNPGELAALSERLRGVDLTPYTAAATRRALDGLAAASAGAAPPAAAGTR